MDHGGVVTRISPLGATGDGPRELAYRIRRNQVNHTTGFYVNICAFASPRALAEVQRRLHIDERVLRHLAVRKPHMAAIQAIPAVDSSPPPGRGLDPTDPEYALQKFLQEYQRDFPKGSAYSAEEPEEVALPEDVAPSKLGDDDAVQAVVEDLRATSTAATPKGLGWILDLNKNSGPPRTGPRGC